jgi:predicted alpha/beta superfamily hydrolase
MYIFVSYRIVFNSFYMKHLLMIAACLLLVFCSEPVREDAPLVISGGRIIRIEDFPSRYVTARHVDVWLPAQTDAGDRCAVLYMHDGQMLFDSTHTWNRQEWKVDETMDSLISHGIIGKTIVVGIWNDPPYRHSDYFPQKPFESLPAGQRDSLLQLKRGGQAALFATEVRSDGYLKFIAGELKPYIDSRFPTLPGREHTYVAGSSMGGLVSLYALCEYPEVFGGAACLSTHWPGVFGTENNPVPAALMAYLEECLPPPGNHKIYFDYGTESLDALYEPFQDAVDSLMHRKGYGDARWITLKFDGKDHSEKAWSERLHIPLAFLLGD